MAEKLQTLIDSARELSLVEQLELIRVVSQFVGKAYPRPATSLLEFKTIEQLVQEQQVRPAEKLEDLAVDFWPEDETTGMN